MTQALIQAPLSQGAFSLKKSQLFIKSNFTDLFNHADKKHGRLFILFYKVIPEGQVSAFGTVVSKKNAKTSVRRNLIKRLIREYFRLGQHDLPGLHLMLMTKKGVDVATREELHQDLAQLFSFLKKIRLEMGGNHD